MPIRPPIPPAHLLLDPREHIGYLFDVEGPCYRDVGLRSNLAIPLELATGAHRMGVAAEGCGVLHLHVYLVAPRGTASTPAWGKRCLYVCDDNMVDQVGQAAFHGAAKTEIVACQAAPRAAQLAADVARVARLPSIALQQSVPQS